MDSITENQTCPTVGYQAASVCVPVTVTPYANDRTLRSGIRVYHAGRLSEAYCRDTFEGVKNYFAKSPGFFRGLYVIL